MKVCIALVYVTDVRPEEAEDPQTHTFERIMGPNLPHPADCELVFASSVLAYEGTLDDFDGDVTVTSNQRELEAVPYP